MDDNRDVRDVIKEFTAIMERCFGVGQFEIHFKEKPYRLIAGDTPLPIRSTYTTNDLTPKEMLNQAKERLFHDWFQLETEESLRVDQWVKPKTVYEALDERILGLTKKEQEAHRGFYAFNDGDLEMVPAETYYGVAAHLFNKCLDAEYVPEKSTKKDVNIMEALNLSRFF